jgi:hypothetical protein
VAHPEERAEGRRSWQLRIRHPQRHPRHCQARRRFCVAPDYVFRKKEKCIVCQLTCTPQNFSQSHLLLFPRPPHKHKHSHLHLGKGGGGGGGYENKYNFVATYGRRSIPFTNGSILALCRTNSASSNACWISSHNMKSFLVSGSVWQSM